MVQFIYGLSLNGSSTDLLISYDLFFSITFKLTFYKNKNTFNNTKLLLFNMNTNMSGVRT